MVLRLVMKLVALLVLVASVASCRAFYRVFGEFPAPRRVINVVNLTPKEIGAVYGKISNYLLEQNFIEKPPLKGDCEALQYKLKHCYIRTFHLTESDNRFVLNVLLYIDSSRRNVAYYLDEIDAASPPNFPAKEPPVFSPQACRAIAQLNAYVISLVGKHKLTYGYEGVASESHPKLTLQKYIGCSEAEKE